MCGWGRSAPNVGVEWGTYQDTWPWVLYGGDSALGRSVMIRLPTWVVFPQVGIVV